MADWEFEITGDTQYSTYDISLDSDNPYEGTFSVRLKISQAGYARKASARLKYMKACIREGMIATWARGESGDVYGYFTLGHTSYGRIEARNLRNFDNWTNYRCMFWYNKPLNFKMYRLEKWNEEIKDWELVKTGDLGQGEPVEGFLFVGLTRTAVGYSKLWADHTSIYIGLE